MFGMAVSTAQRQDRFVQHFSVGHLVRTSEKLLFAPFRALADEDFTLCIPDGSGRQSSGQLPFTVPPAIAR